MYDLVSEAMPPLPSPPDRAKHGVVVGEAAVEQRLPVETWREVEVTRCGGHVTVVVVRLEDCKDVCAVLSHHVGEQRRPLKCMACLLVGVVVMHGVRVGSQRGGSVGVSASEWMH